MTLPSWEDAIALKRTAVNIGLTGDLMTAIGAATHGLQTEDAADFQAEQLRANAGQAQASGQRRAADVDQRAQLVASRALAVAAASGGGASDPGVVSIMAGIAQEGAYRRSVALYEGDARAAALETAANGKDYEGDSARVHGLASAVGLVINAGTGYFKGRAATTLMEANAGQQGGASLFNRFGMGAPNAH
jgi:hypothetical protein